MAHARAAVFADLKTKLAAAVTPAVVYDQDETAPEGIRYVSLRFLREEPGESSSKDTYERVLSFAVACVGLTTAERDALSEQVEGALLGDDVGLPILDIDWEGTGTELAPTEAGDRVCAAVYEFTGRYFTARIDSSTKL